MRTMARTFRPARIAVPAVSRMGEISPLRMDTSPGTRPTRFLSAAATADGTATLRFRSDWPIALAEKTGNYLEPTFFCRRFAREWSDLREFIARFGPQQIKTGKFFGEVLNGILVSC